MKYSIIYTERKKEVTTMKDIQHAAYNLTTGEVCICLTGNQLKRHVAHIEKTNRKLNYGKGKWVFAHGAYAFENLMAKKAVKLIACYV